MKKLIILVCVVLVAFLSVSCIGWESGIVSTKKDQSVNSITTKIQAEINQVFMKKWLKNNRVYVNVAIEIENTGQEKFKVEKIVFDFISKEGKIVNEDDDSYVVYSTYPRVFYRGDVGYASFTQIFNRGTNVDDIYTAEATVYYTQTLRTRKEILVKDVEIVSHTPLSYGESTAPSTISAEVSVVNNTTWSIEDYSICIILYDQDSQILDILTANRDNNNCGLKPGEESKQATLYSDANFDEVYPKIKTVKSYCWTYSGGY
jgi:hypothetical protein